MSSSPLPLACIDANPDIAGIGVRVAIYAQNFLALFVAVAALRDRYVSWTELRIVEGLSMSILLTACALLLSAVVQAVKLGMSTYHALVILNLAWMNNTNTFVYAILFRYQGILQAPNTPSRKQGGAPLPKRKALPLLIIGSLHLSFVGGFGLWFWKTVDMFGTSSQCMADLPVPLVILGRHVPVTSRALQKLSFAIYGVISVPVVNLTVAVAVIYGSASLSYWALGAMGWTSRDSAFFGPGYLSLIFLAGVNIVITINTETMVHFMKPYVRSGESEWTFGQTLAMFLLIMPLRDILLVLIGDDKKLIVQREALDKRWKAQKIYEQRRPKHKGAMRVHTRSARPSHALSRPRPAHSSRRPARPAPVRSGQPAYHREVGNTEPDRAATSPLVPTPPSGGRPLLVMPHHSSSSHSTSTRRAASPFSPASTTSTCRSRANTRHPRRTSPLPSPPSPSPSRIHSRRAPSPPPSLSSVVPEPSTSMASVHYWRLRPLPPTPSTTTINL